MIEPERLAATGSYEASVQWLRAQPEHARLVRDAYLDDDNLGAAQRFAASDEFVATLELLSLRDESPARVLDVGGGNGIAAWALAHRGHDVTAVDPDPSDDVGLGAVARLCRVAAESLPGRIRPIRAPVERLPFRDGAFDRIYVRQALHHFSDLRGGIAECARVLRPGGVLVAAREHVVTDAAELGVFLAAHPLQPVHGGEHAYPVREYVAALRAAGLRVRTSLGPFDSPVNTHPRSPTQIHELVHGLVARRLGGALASLLMSVPWCRRAFRRRLSRLDRNPGRLFTFVATR